MYQLPWTPPPPRPRTLFQSCPGLDLVGPAKPHLARSLLLDVEDRSNSAVVAAIEECCKASGRKFDIRKVKASRIEHRRFPGIEAPEAEYPSGFLRVRAFRDEQTRLFIRARGWSGTGRHVKLRKARSRLY